MWSSHPGNSPGAWELLRPPPFRLWAVTRAPGRERAEHGARTSQHGADERQGRRRVPCLAFVTLGCALQPYLSYL